MKNIKLWELGRVEQVEFLRRSFALCDDWWLDELDCRVSCHRRVVNGVSFDEALGFFRDDSLSSCIFRKGFGSEGDHYEVGFREMSSDVDHFLFIIVGVEFFDDLCAIYRELGGVLD